MSLPREDLRSSNDATYFLRNGSKNCLLGIRAKIDLLYSNARLSQLLATVSKLNCAVTPKRNSGQKGKGQLRCSPTEET